MKVSIVTSVLNGARFLPKCINSVSSQTYSCEHVIVDGGSTDGSQDLLRKAELPNLRFIDAPGTGISEAFGLGIQNSSGEVIAILNADDWLENDAVERSVQALSDHPQAGFTYGSVMLHSRARTMIVNPKYISENLGRWATKQMLFYHISSFVRRSIYDKYGLYDSRLNVAMDYDFYARITSKGVRGVYVSGIIAHALAGGVSSNIVTRSKDYYYVLSRYYGKLCASYYMTKYALNSYVYQAMINNYFSRSVLCLISKRRFLMVSAKHSGGNDF